MMFSLGFENALLKDVFPPQKRYGLVAIGRIAHARYRRRVLD